MNTLCASCQKKQFIDVDHLQATLQNLKSHTMGDKEWETGNIATITKGTSDQRITQHVNI
jgi:hypothetical protein